MLRIVSPRGARAVVGVLVVVAGAGLVVAAALGRQSPRERLATRLMSLDPGARIGANTQVGTTAGARLLGSRRRANFMIGLGARQRIVGGPGHDQLGARGAAGVRVHGGGGHDLIHGGRGDQLLAGGAGDDLIYGGAGRDRLDGGPGNDRLIDRQGATVVVTGPGRNRVDVADGDGDERVLCAPGSVNRIEADRGDRLRPSCRRGASSVRYRRPPSGAPTAHAAQVTGSGTNDDPYVTTDCVLESKFDEHEIYDCTFPARALSGLWANEYVPAYKCPASFPWLLFFNYAPSGTQLPDGVEVDGLGPIGVSISGVSSAIPGPDSRRPGKLATGTLTGFPNSSATSWRLGINSYTVVLHCVPDPNDGWP
jgi:hypothetical protein